MNSELAATLWVALGGGLGGVTRYSIDLAATRLVGDAFPWGTLLVNVLGSFLIGYLGVPGLGEPSSGAGADLQFLTALGVYGGFTTFSCFSLQTIELLRDGRVVRAGGFVLGSLVLGLGAAVLGIYVGSPVLAGTSG